MEWFNEQRNFILGAGYIGACLMMAHMAGSEEIRHLGPTLVSMGAAVGGIVFGRAFALRGEARKIEAQNGAKR